MAKLNRRLPPIKSLIAFEAAVRHRSFTRAADELALSQASVSRRVRELEAGLGVRLFERQRYDVKPTADAESFAERVRHSLSDLAAAADQLRNRGTAADRLTIFSDLSLASVLLAPVVGEFQRRHPNIQLHILSASEAIDSFSEEFDFGLQYGRYAEHAFDIDPIADDVLFPVCSPQLAKQLPESLGAVELAQQRLLHFVEEDRNWPDWRQFLASFGVKESPTIQGLVFSSHTICLDVAEKGEGVALAWGRTVKPRLDIGRLQRISGLSIPLPDAINVFRSKLGSTNAVSDQFLDLLRHRIEPTG